ncbi:hypothetical protein PHET_03642 [Paragonimus heterotremus]|uniref:Peptidase S1 domain-containing protein n=1 Tax=Paragonimus heterotremus TaxID=100268 RepID=A0A8J4TBZ3_9TREM|nr:hypothetical protein PHET_03642 [Paragonimus heterotremus]
MQFTPKIQTASGLMTKRIINGQEATNGAYPWAVFLKVSHGSVNYCGATVIADRWLLTAAHCFWPTDKQDSVQPTTGILHFDADWIFTHPNYRPGMNINDIALLKIRGKFPLDQNRVSQVELPLDSVVVRWPTLYTSCILVGWGCTKANGPVSNKARILEMRVLQSQACSEMYDGSFVMDSRFQLCAGYYMSDTSACQGDSGGGLICNLRGKSTIGGVLSAGHPNQTKSYPMLFSRTSAYTSWVQDVMAKS